MARPVYRKGNSHSGGGGHRGGGGKKGRPATGWEKGDISRDIDDSDSPFEVPTKPGRKYLLKDPPEVKLKKAEEHKAALKGFPKLSVTFKSAGVLVPLKFQRTIKTEMTKMFTDVSRVQSAIVSFETIKGSIENLNTICEIKIKLRGLQTTFVEYIAEDLKSAYSGASKRILELVQDTLKRGQAKARRVPKQAEKLGRSGLPSREAEA